MDQARINVLIVTYKQADVIRRNLDSILQQKVYGLNKIIICDDCSPDKNWEVIQGYVKQYPETIVAYRNNPNLGIYGNSNKLASLCGDADLYCWLEGDDALCDGFFKSTQEYIHNNKIDLSQSLGIFGDYIAINTRGGRALKKNDFVEKGYDPFGAYLRGLATWRGSVFTKSVLQKFLPVETEKGLILAETLFDSQFFRFIDKAYYNPIAGSIYYTGIGVSVTWDLLKSSSYETRDRILMWKYLEDNGLIKEPDDLCWAKSKISYSKCLEKFSFSEFVNYSRFYKKGMSKYNVSLKLFLTQTAQLFYKSIIRIISKKK